MVQDGSRVAESRIRQLDEVTANQIAAGEVVERPASVVKEVLENAIDAEATRITVEVEEGGSRLIRVTDDGHGMSPADARLSLERHATSKIRNAQDLTTVRTMGFRGEALPSIASVSRFTLISRTADSDEAVKIEVEGGHIKDDGRTGAALGTSVEVADLFFNVPARKKFLKRPATELGHISDTVVRLAIAYPQVSFRLKHGPKVLLDAPRATDEDPKGRLGRILGRKVADALHPIPSSGSVAPVVVTGYAGAPVLTERTTRGQYVFVNGRFVRDRTIQHAIQDGYRTLMEKGRYPVVILHLQVDPTTFDVNVHPQKTEVRFERTGEIHRAVTGALRRTLVDQPWLESGQYAVAVARSASAAIIRDGDDKGLSRFVGLSPIDVPRTYDGSSSAGDPAQGTGPSPALGDLALSPPLPAVRPAVRSEMGAVDPDWSRPASHHPTEPPEALPYGQEEGLVAKPQSGLFERAAGRFSRLVPVGQVLGTYLVCQGPEEMVVIDQHAAHERIAFQRMRTQRASAAVATQPLLMPIPMELDEKRAEAADAHSARLSELGFELAPFGGRTWLVKSTPAALVGADVERLVLDVLDELTEVEQTTAFDDHIDAVLSCAACHSVVRAGDRLSRDEIQALLQQMDEIDFGAHCPHGRPVFVRWTGDALAKMFHRT